MKNVIEFIEKMRSGESCVIADRLYVVTPTLKGNGKIIYIGRWPNENGISEELMKSAIMDSNGVIHCYKGILDDLISYSHKNDPLPDGIVKYSSKEFTDIVCKDVEEMCKDLDYDMNDLTPEQYNNAKELALNIAVGYIGESVLDTIVSAPDFSSKYEDYLLGLTTYEESAADYFENNKENLISCIMTKEKARFLLKAYSKRPEMQLFSKIINFDDEPKYLTLNLEKSGKTTSIKVETSWLRHNIHHYMRHDMKKQIIESASQLMIKKDSSRIRTELNTTIYDITFDDLESVTYNGKTLYERNKDS